MAASPSGAAIRNAGSWTSTQLPFLYNRAAYTVTPYAVRRRSAFLRGEAIALSSTIYRRIKKTPGEESDGAALVALFIGLDKMALANTRRGPVSQVTRERGHSSS